MTLNRSKACGISGRTDAKPSRRQAFLAPSLPDAKDLSDSKPSGFLRKLRRTFHAATCDRVGAVLRSGYQRSRKFERSPARTILTQTALFLVRAQRLKGLNHKLPMAHQ